MKQTVHLRLTRSDLIDEGTREALEIVVDTSLPAARVIRELEQITSVRGKPKRIRVDNGPEMLAQVFTDWCKDNHVELVYIQPDKPNQNAYIERFNRSYRTRGAELLSVCQFEAGQRAECGMANQLQRRATT